jgi:ElaB/YqjD/DUF883 family membrane-anchored ribosome-binding protein
MGILNDMKKLLFGAKAVGKSTTQKAVDAGKEAGEELMDKTGEMLEKAKVKTEDLGDKILTAGEKAFQSVESFVEDLTKEEEKEEKMEEPEKPAAPQSQASQSTTPPPPPQEPEPLHPFVEKAQETAEKVGGKVLQAGEKALDKAGDLAEKVGDKVMDKGEDVMKTFQGAAEKAGKKFEDFFEKAQEEAAKEQAESSIVQDAKKAADDATSQMDELLEKAKEFSDQPPKTSAKLSQSELSGKDDFFEKAKRFAEGDYHNTGKKEEEGKITISNDPDHQPKKKDVGEIKGFDDNDGDGDHLIDDAIIDDEK